MTECIVAGIAFSDILLPDSLCPIWVSLTVAVAVAVAVMVAAMAHNFHFA
jgi:hypothetical protein